MTFEESTLSQWLYVNLKDEVDKLVVCDPAAINKKPGAKTDKIDAIELADLLRVGRLSPVFHTADERMELRTLVSGYTDLVQSIVRAKNRYKAIFRQAAIRLKGTTSFTDSGWLSELSTKTQQFVAKPLLEQIELLEKHKKRYLRKFRQNLKRFKEMRLIRTIPGFDIIRANQVVGIVVSPHRFANKYHFFSYAMLVKHRQMSDGTSYGNKRAYGKTQLKSIFKMAARNALQTDNAFHRRHQQMLADGAKEQAARNWVARALAATVLAIWKNGTKFEDHYWEVTRQARTCRDRA